MDEGRKMLESRFVVGPKGNWALSATGEPYVEVVSGGIHNEGESIALGTSPEQAIRLWWDAMLRYAENRRGILYWRIEPEIEHCDYRDEAGKHRFWKVYSRLLISDEPQSQAAWLSPQKAALRSKRHYHK